MATTENYLTKRLIRIVTNIIIDNWLRKFEVGGDETAFPKELSSEICKYHNVVLLFGESTEFKPKALLDLADISNQSLIDGATTRLLIQYFCMIDFEDIDQERFKDNGPLYIKDQYDRYIEYVLSDMERMILNRGFNNYIKEKLTSFHKIRDNESEIAQKYCKIIVSEIMDICLYSINLFENTLIPISKSMTLKNRKKYDEQSLPDGPYDIYIEIVEYLTMCADCYRFICEIRKDENDFEYYKKRAEIHYKDGERYCEKPDKYKLRGYNHTLQKLKMKYCIFLADICDNKESAIKVGKKMFLDGVQAIEIKSLSGPYYKDEYDVIHALKSKLDSWDPNINYNS